MLEVPHESGGHRLHAQISGLGLNHFRGTFSPNTSNWHTIGWTNSVSTSHQQSSGTSCYHHSICTTRVPLLAYPLYFCHTCYQLACWQPSTVPTSVASRFLVSTLNIYVIATLRIHTYFFMLTSPIYKRPSIFYNASKMLPSDKFNRPNQRLDGWLSLNALLPLMVCKENAPTQQLLANCYSSCSRKAFMLITPLTVFYNMYIQQRLNSFPLTLNVGKVVVF